MTYEPTIWNDGDTITEERLNKLEQGVENEQVGPAGEDGVAAGFGTPKATVDSNTGTPEVEVSASGPDTAKVFTFTFKNLKGEKGEKGDTGAAGAKGDKGETGAQGPKGDPGAGLTGSASSVAAIDTPDSADAATIAAKVNEVITQLKARGVIS